MLLLAQWHPVWISDPQNYDDVVQSLSHIPLFEILCTAACQASLSFSISQSLFKFMSTELVMLSNHLILCCTLLLPSIIPSIQVFPNESALHIMWPKYKSFGFSISPSYEYSELISFRIKLFDRLAVQGTLNINFHNIKLKEFKCHPEKKTGY